MGRQVNFFMLPDDERRFGGEVGRIGGRLLYFRSPDPIVRLCHSLPEPGGDPSWDELCLVPQHRVAEVRVWEVPVDERLFIIDEENSPVVQFHRCRCRNDTLLGGRIWALMYSEVWDSSAQSQVVRHKGDDFQQFYMRLARWVRRHFVREAQFGFYAGPAACYWHERGGRFGQF